MRRPDIKLVVRTLSFLLLFEAGFMALAGGVSLAYGDGDYPYYFATAAATLVICLIGILTTPKMHASMGKREGFLIVSLVWVVFSLIGMLPMYLSGAAGSITDAFFETMSGFTTTGMTIFTDVESLTHGTLFWRSIMQWVGGLGIITMSLALLPIIGSEGMNLFAAEVPGVSKAKLHARIGQTSKFFWIVYVGLTILAFGSFRLSGMEFFDAMCHAFSTMSTGGFSTRNESMAYFASPAMEYVTIIFMILGGTNFSLYFYLIKGMPLKFLKNEELHYYIGIIAAFSLILACSLFLRHTCPDVETSIRYALFNVVSVMTTTGFTTSDYMTWNAFAWTILILVMFFGGMSGSTSGGMKTARIALMIKNGYYEFRRLAHPKAIIPVRFENQLVSIKMLNSISAFAFLYLGLSILGSLIMTACGMGFLEALSASVSAIGNVGVAMGEIGPATGISGIPDLCKWVMAALMLIGRLELFTVLILFTPAFWKQ